MIGRNTDEIRCARCKKRPFELSEYADLAVENNRSADDEAMDDGTFNPRSNQFYCTKCYYEIGMPLGKAP